MCLNFFVFLFSLRVPSTGGIDIQFVQTLSQFNLSVEIFSFFFLSYTFRASDILCK